MDTSLLASHCIELLRTHNRVSLGNMGSFMAEDTPATLTHNLHVLLPPGRRISFKESETWNDGLLEKVYGDPDALEALLSEVSKKLVREKSVTLDGFGKLRRTREGDVFFVMDKNVSVNPGGFGLVPLSMSPLSTPSRINCATLDPQPEEGIEEPDGSCCRYRLVYGVGSFVPVATWYTVSFASASNPARAERLCLAKVLSNDNVEDDTTLTCLVPYIPTLPLVEVTAKCSGLKYLLSSTRE